MDLAGILKSYLTDVLRYVNILEFVNAAYM